MNLSQVFIEALESLNSNKLRSGLTVLGIVIGVAAVIILLSVGNGAQASITGSINGIGTNLLFVFRGASDNETVRNPRPLTLGDANAMLDPFAAPHVQAVAPALQGSGEVDFSGQTKSTTVWGVTPEFFQVRNLGLLEGDFISEDHLLGRASVVLLGVDVADKLFGHRDGLIGETVRIGGQPFRVIGVLEPKGGGSFGSQDDRVLVPFTTAQARLLHRSSPETVDIIFIQATDSETVSQAADEVSQVLRTRHRTPVGQDDFTVFTQQDFLSTAQSITGILTIFLGVIGAISLLVGGVGIMNIMLVSVTERTREIGLRKALGARKRDILIQFLAESSLLSFIGGLTGIVFGWLISFLIGRIAIATGNDFTPVVTGGAIALAIIVSTAIGLFFGIYPAYRGAGLEPVEALRYE
jgi:putative ABC transport system permease protein